MQREWRRNVLLISLNTIWASKMQGWQFTSVKQLVEEYHKHIAMVANLTHFYFREAFQLLKSKQFPTFTYLQDETAHHIVNALPDWEDIYHSKLVPLLQKENIQANMEPNFEFDLGSLQINENYMEKEDEEDEEEGGRVNRGEIEETRETVETRETGTNLASLKEGKGASRGVQLGETIRKIRQFTQEHTLQSKMIRLK